MPDGSLSRDLKDREDALNNHLRDKFCAQPAPFDCWENVNMDLHTDGNVLSAEAVDRLVL